uniref:Uncharacterized protein n=1 Tax=Romanomermis culicivorax TaxID=13658 RepID=A0A915IKZ6_ROMCU
MDAKNGQLRMTDDDDGHFIERSVHNFTQADINANRVVFSYDGAYGKNGQCNITHEEMFSSNVTHASSENFTYEMVRAFQFYYLKALPRLI